MEKHLYKRYPDGAGYWKLPGTSSAVFGSSEIARINSYEDLWRFAQLVYQRDNWVEKYTIPNLIDGQADRPFGNQKVSGLSIVCGFLRSLQVNLRIFHPHNPEVVQALIPNAEIIMNDLFVDTVVNYISNTTDNLDMLAPDAGAYKNVMRLADEIDFQGAVYSASKMRPAIGEMKQIVPVEDFGGRDILIVDDICVFGGTFKNLAKELRKRNVGRLFLAVSHMTVQTHKNKDLFYAFDHIYTTSSKYTEYFVKGREEFHNPKNLTVIPIEQVI